MIDQMKPLFLAALISSLAVHDGFSQSSTTSTRSVSESERLIPLAYDVDVVVVGGTLRGVAAAEAAARNGAKVFLATDRPYLGEDVCGTYRLWLEEDEQPETQLGQAIYGDAMVQTNLQSEDCLPFAYSASLKSHSRHPDTGSMLADGKFSEVGPDSVQYNGDVTLIADLGKPMQLAGVRLMAFNRADDFVIERVPVSVSSDKQSWQSLGDAQNILPRLEARDVPVLHALDQTVTARYVKVEVAKGEEVERLLVTELAILAPRRRSDAKAVDNRRVVTPMAVKNALDNALLNSKVDFLYGSYVTEVLRDPDGKLAGIVVANRSGRQAIRGKVIIDATDRGVAARIAGAPFTDYPSGPQTFSRIVLGGKPGPKAKDTGLRYQVGGKKSSSYPVYEYEFEIPMRDGSWSSFVEADKIARDQSWHHDQAGYAEMLFQVPPDRVKSEGAYAGPWPGASELPLTALTPTGVDHLFVLGGCADVSRETAGKLLRPLNGIRLGQRVGTVAAQEAASRQFAAANQLVVGGSSGPASIQAEVLGRPASKRKWAKCWKACAGTPLRERSEAQPVRCPSWAVMTRWSSEAEQAVRRPVSPPLALGLARWSSNTCMDWAASEPWDVSRSTTMAIAPVSISRWKKAFPPWQATWRHDRDIRVMSSIKTLTSKPRWNGYAGNWPRPGRMSGSCRSEWARWCKAIASRAWWSPLRRDAA
jgi:hypothetical protein